MSSDGAPSRKHAMVDNADNPNLVISGSDVTSSHQEAPQEKARQDVAYVEAAAQDTAGPWQNLLSEVCNIILDHLSDCVSVMRFPVVCAAWAKAAKEKRPSLLPQSGAPMVITSGLHHEGTSGSDDTDTGAFRLHDVATDKSYYSEADGLKNRVWVGGKDDWLVTTDPRCSVEQLNMITDNRIRLPSFETVPGVQVPGVQSICPYVSCRSAFTDRFRENVRMRKIALGRTPSPQSPSPSQSQPRGYLAVALFSSTLYDNLVAFTKQGHVQWTPLRNSFSGMARDRYVDVTVHKGKVFAVTASAKIYSWEIEEGGEAAEGTIVASLDVFIGDRFNRCTFFLASSSDGDLQLVCAYGDNCEYYPFWRMRVVDTELDFLPRSVVLHERDDVAGAWRRVTDLGRDHALFVGANHAFNIDVSQFVKKDDSRGFSYLRGNLVYVADPVNLEWQCFDVK